MVTLTPVVELEPGAYAKRPREYPQVPGSEDPDGWDDYWRASLADSGITELNPISKGSWLVPIEQLVRPATLAALLGVEHDDPDRSPEDALASICGGYVLESGEKKILPGCCGDLSNLEDWREAAAWHKPEWHMIWIGHPWTHVSADGDTLRFLKPSDNDPPESTEIHLTVSRSDLTAAIEAANALLEQFAGRLRPLIVE